MRRILLTGATGFLGGELVVALSRLNAVEQLACLVRARDLDEATARLRKVFALHGDIYDDRKVIAIAGDLTDSQLAPNLMQQAELADVDTVVHAAASTSFLAQKRNAIEE